MTPLDCESVNLRAVISTLCSRLLDNAKERQEITQSLLQHPLVGRRPPLSTSSSPPTMDLVPAFQTSFKELLHASFRSTLFPKSTTTTTTTTHDDSVDVPLTMTQLTTKLSDASLLAQRVSAQVNALDIQRVRVSSALAASTEIIHLRNCAKNVNLALSHSNVQDAAVQVERFRTAMRGSNDGNGGTSTSDLVDASQAQAVERAALEVDKKVTVSFEEGLKGNDRTSVVEGLETFSHLGPASYETALDMYIDYMLTQLEKYAEENVTSTAIRPGSRSQGLLLSKLLNRTSQMMSSSMVMIDEVLTTKWLEERLEEETKCGGESSSSSGGGSSSSSSNGESSNTNTNTNNCAYLLRRHRRAPVVEVMMRLHQGCSTIACTLLSSFDLESNLNAYTSGVGTDVTTQQDAGR